MVAGHFVAAVAGDSFTEADDGTEDQNPGHDDAGADTCRVRRSRTAVRYGGFEVGRRLRFKSLGQRSGDRLPGFAAHDLERVRGQAEPGHPERPGADDIGQVVHAEHDPADTDRGHEHPDDDRHGFAGASRHARQEYQDECAVADDRAQCVPAGKTVPDPVRDRIRDHRAQPADQCLEDRVERQRAGTSDRKEDGETESSANGQHDQPGHE